MGFMVYSYSKLNKLCESNIGIIGGRRIVPLFLLKQGDCASFFISIRRLKYEQDITGNVEGIERT